MSAALLTGEIDCPRAMFNKVHDLSSLSQKGAEELMALLASLSALVRSKIDVVEEQKTLDEGDLALRHSRPNHRNTLPFWSSTQQTAVGDSLQPLLGMVRTGFSTKIPEDMWNHLVENYPSKLAKHLREAYTECTKQANLQSSTNDSSPCIDPSGIRVSDTESHAHFVEYFWNRKGCDTRNINRRVQDIPEVKARMTLTFRAMFPDGPYWSALMAGYSNVDDLKKPDDNANNFPASMFKKLFSRSQRAVLSSHYSVMCRPRLCLLIICFWMPSP
jgi:hypothetical protein